MPAAERPITDNLDIWSSAIKTKSAAGRGKSNKLELYGIKKLRELILVLAVRGLLVPQDSNDEPTGKLLAKIVAERTKLVKEGKLRKRKKLAAISEDEKVFSLPVGWEYVRLNDLGDWGAGATPSRRSPELYGGDIPWFKSGELVGDYISESEEYVTERALETTSLRPNKKGDVLLAMYGATIGKASILSVPATTNQAVCACTPFTGVENSFLLTLLKAYKGRFIGMGAGGAQPNISREKIIATVVALPPSAEQHRIVAKVDELMTLCDQLEQQQESSITAHQTLVQTLLDTLTTASDREGFTAAWARIADHFDTLFTTDWSIDQLKQTILQLAVMGKLAPQDPNDESALEAYTRTIGLPDGYVRSNKQKVRGKNFVLIKDLPALPEGWEYFSVDHLYKSNHILDYADGNHGSLYPRKSDFGVEGVLFLTAAQIDKRGRVDWDECPRLDSSYAKKLTKGWSEEGDVYFTHNATVGRTAIAIGAPEKRFLLGTSVTFYRINGFTIFPGYLYTFLSSPAWYNQAAAVMRQTTRNQVSITKQALFYIALPPIEEQKRIVARVDELMTFCDELKSCLNTAQTTQLQLADVIEAQSERQRNVSP